MFVEREAERRLLGELVERIREGTGGAVWLAGDPGIGKSALIAAALDGVDRDGCRVYYGAASEQSPIFPLQVLLEVLGTGVPFGTPDATEPDSVRESRVEIASLLYGGHAEAHTPLGVINVAAERLVALVHRLCAISPVILVVDDTQWADQASLEVLTRLTRTLSQLPLLLVTAVRPVPARAEVSALRQALARLARQAGHQPGDVDKLDDGRNDSFGLDDRCERLQARVRQFDDADVRLDRAERIVLGRDAVLRQRVEQGRLADVGQADNAAFEAHGTVLGKVRRGAWSA